MSSQVQVKPDEDARLPILEAQIEREWRQSRPGYVKNLLKEKNLRYQVNQVALSCIRLANQYEERGLGADQAREAQQALIHPQRSL